MRFIYKQENGEVYEKAQEYRTDEEWVYLRACQRYIGDLIRGKRSVNDVEETNETQPVTDNVDVKTFGVTTDENTMKHGFNMVSDESAEVTEETVEEGADE
jgi:hypothetical protein